MKKITLCCAVLGLTACPTNTNTDNGLKMATTEPTDCEFLYNLNSSITNYRLMDKHEYIEKTILEQKQIGDTYYIVSEDITNNPGAVFGPEQTYKFKVKVYSCNK